MTSSRYVGKKTNFSGSYRHTEGMAFFKLPTSYYHNAWQLLKLMAWWTNPNDAACSLIDPIANAYCLIEATRNSNASAFGPSPLWCDIQWVILKWIELLDHAGGVTTHAVQGRCYLSVCMRCRAGEQARHSWLRHASDQSQNACDDTYPIHCRQRRVDLYSAPLTCRLLPSDSRRVTV